MGVCCGSSQKEKVDYKKGEMVVAGKAKVAAVVVDSSIEKAKKKTRGKTVIMPQTSMDDFYEKNAPAGMANLSQEDLEFEQGDFNLRNTEFFDINELTMDRW